eukprot:TRINITY_DN55246_c0_g1_i1.p1 TRINITY_DN55246_c0_g1~~TRINITY_DN55246_c0_g1_i1.p1  ORF type:complete len:1070 (-),score=128.54 TRINITY_DN55246_c0_g1_i1:141-2948(-)
MAVPTTKVAASKMPTTTAPPPDTSKSNAGQQSLFRRRLVGGIRCFRGSLAESQVVVPSLSTKIVCDELPSLAPSDQGDILLRGIVVHVNGSWRKKPKVQTNIAEIQRRTDVGSNDFVFRRCAFTKEGQPDLSSLRIMRLAGSAVEAIDLPEHPSLFCFRIYSLPDARFSSNHLDFAVVTESERAQWLETLDSATRHFVEDGTPVSGRLQVSIVEFSFEGTEEQSWVRSSSKIQEMFVVVSVAGVKFRTVPRNATANFVDARSCAPLSRNVELPVVDDDPDALVTFEVWVTMGRKGFLPHGTISVPLYCFGRNCLREVRLPLRDQTIRGRAADNAQIGNITIAGSFQQHLHSLMLPRVAPVTQTNRPWLCVGEKPLREQYREFEAFMQDFTVFSRRFMHHCDAWRGFSARCRRILQWDRPAVTSLCILAITAIVGFFHEHVLPIFVFALLCVTAWQHPSSCRLRASLSRTARSLGACFQKCILICRRRSVVGLILGILSSTKSTGEDSHTRLIAESSTANSAMRDEDAHCKIVERIENERRLFFGKFCCERLRFYDPAAWCNGDGQRAEPPRPTEEGAHYVWWIEVNQHTDSDGWRYARNFGKASVWSGAFQLGVSFVRSRRHLGRPLLASSSSQTSLQDSSVSLSQRRKSAVSSGCNVQTALISCDGCLQPATRRFQKLAPFTTFNGTAVFKLSPSDASKTVEEAPAESVMKGPEFGIAKTPFHDMYQQCLMRWAYVQRNIEYWMDWYERRKNLFSGVTWHTQTIAFLGVLVLFYFSLILPTRWLLLVSIYGFFMDGWMLGRLMRQNELGFIQTLKVVASAQWLEAEAKAAIESWSTHTCMTEIADAGVQLLKLRDWIQTEFYDGRPMIPLRALQRCRTLGELAGQVVWTSDKFTKRRLRKRVCYLNTFRNLLDHVPSDITRFLPYVCHGQGDCS